MLKTSPGNVHQILLLENAQLASRVTEPALRRLYAPHNFLRLLPTNHAPFRDATRPLASARTSIQDILLENVYLLQHPCRDPMVLSHGCARLFSLVLPYRTTPKRGGSKSDGRKRTTDVPFYTNIPNLC